MSESQFHEDYMEWGRGPGTKQIIELKNKRVNKILKMLVKPILNTILFSFQQVIVKTIGDSVTMDQITKEKLIDIVWSVDVEDFIKNKV
jgi:hypothetical protein